MGLLPEFFVVLGIAVFLAASLVSSLLDDDLSPLIQYLFQGAALVGFAYLLLSRGFVTSGTSIQSLSDPTRFLISIAYLLSAVSSELGLNVYVVVIRRRVSLASALSGVVTVPTLAISITLILSYLLTAGEVIVSAATVVVLTVSAVVVCISLSGIFTDAYAFIVRREDVPQTVPVSTPIMSQEPNSPALLPPAKADDIWEEFLARKKGQEEAR
jgi:hypothetical protein